MAGPPIKKLSVVGSAGLSGVVGWNWKRARVGASSAGDKPRNALQNSTFTALVGGEALELYGYRPYRRCSILLGLQTGCNGEWGRNDWTFTESCQYNFRPIGS